MSQKPNHSGKNEGGEYATFESALKKVLSVSHDEVKARFSAAKSARQRDRKTSGRAFRAKD